MAKTTDKSREKLLRAGAKLFAVRSFDAVSTRDLCEKAKVNVAAISYHFAGKEGLYAAVFDESAQLLSKKILVVLRRRADDLAEFLENLIHSMLSIRQNHPQVSILLRHQGTFEIPAVKVIFESVLRPLGDKIVARLSELQRMKLIRKDLHLRSFLVILFESVWGYFSMQERSTELSTDAFQLPKDHEQFVAFLSDLYLRAIRA